MSEPEPVRAEVPRVRRAAVPARPAAPWAQGRVLAASVWRLAWREPLTRLLLGLAILLALVGTIAAIGSPSAGDGAIQMLAVCLQIVPFAVVLLAGDIWRHDADEAAVFARPVDALTYVLGRAAGLCLVGLGLLAAVGAVSVLGLWAIARLPLLPSLGWTGLFSAVYVAPGFLLLGGACLLWLARGGGGPRYHAAVIVGALFLAFYDYKLDALAAHARVLAFLAPFPGFLTLGLALPPSPLGAPAVPGWLVWNRLLYALVGFGLLLLAARRRARAFPRLPLRRPRRTRTLGIATGAAAAGCLALLLPAVPRLAPAVMPAAPSIPVPAPAAGSLTLDVAADAASGHLSGTALWGLRQTGATVDVLLNAGLTLTAPPGVAVTLPDGSSLVPGTAARLYALTGVGSGPLRLGFRGRLLPVPSALPYPPFPLGQAFEGAALGHGRAFFDGRGTWYPLVVGPGLRAAAPAHVSLRLDLSGSPSPWLGVSTARYVGASLPPVIGAAAPYRTYTGPGWSLRAAAAPTASTRAVLATYAHAARLLAPLVSGDLPVSGRLRAVQSPLLLSPLLSAQILWIPGAQPFCVPPDAVSGACAGAAPDLEAATLLLSRLVWAARMELPGGNLALPAQVGRAAVAAELLPRAAVTAWEALGEPSSIAAAWKTAAALPVLGRLNAAQRSQAAALAAAAPASG
jgi:hypothetical protein